MKVVEMQRRGLPHFHAVTRSDAASEPGQQSSPPDTSVSACEFVAMVHQAAIDTELTARRKTMIRFGDQLDINLIGRGDMGEAANASVSSRQIAAYLAKYGTKSIADFGIGTRKFSPTAIDQFNVTEHLREILRTIVTLADEEHYGEILSCMRTLGYGGHAVSKSRQFSKTMTALRERRAAWRKEQAQGDATSGAAQNEYVTTQWEFERLGHTGLGDRVLVASAFARSRTTLRRAKCNERRSVKR